jgi:MoaA/NifB/PqqE/SkfB family radical SAM enzyme
MGLWRIWFSINGFGDVRRIMPGIDHDLVRRNLASLLEREKRPGVRLSLVVTKHNMGQIRPLIEWGIAHGVEQVSISALDRLLNQAAYDRLSPTRAEFGREHAELVAWAEREPQLRVNSAGVFWPPDDMGPLPHCKIPNVNFGIFWPNGLVYTCCYAAAQGRPTGNIREQSFDQIWDGPNYAAARKQGFEFCQRCTAAWRDPEPGPPKRKRR